MLAKGDFKFRLHGEKLKGDFVLARMRSRRPGSKGTEWLLIKKRDEHVQEGFDANDPQFDRSLSNPTMRRGSNVLRNLGSRRNNEVLRRARWFVLLDNQIFIEPADALCHQTRNGKPLESFCSFFTADYMKSLFPGATVQAPVQREWQHCCVLRAFEFSL